MKHEEKVSKNEFDVNDNIADAKGGRHKDSDDLKDKNIDNVEVFNNDGKGSGIFHVLKVLCSTFTTICNLPLTVTNQTFCFMFIGRIINVMFCNYTFSCLFYLFMSFFKRIETTFSIILRHCDEFLSYTCLTKSNYSRKSQYPSLNFNYTAKNEQPVLA